jgi:hypothetical protein
MIGDIFHTVVYPTEQIGDKVFGGHGEVSVAKAFWVKYLTTLDLLHDHYNLTSTKGYNRYLHLTLFAARLLKAAGFLFFPAKPASIPVCLVLKRAPFSGAMPVPLGWKDGIR